MPIEISFVVPGQAKDVKNPWILMTGSVVRFGRDQSYARATSANASKLFVSVSGSQPLFALAMNE